MKKLFYLFISALTLAITMPAVALAHPGNVDSEGYHYCRTNCDYWGVAWNEKHYHGKKVSKAKTAAKTKAKKAARQ